MRKKGKNYLKLLGVRLAILLMGKAKTMHLI